MPAAAPLAEGPGEVRFDGCPLSVAPCDATAPPDGCVEPVAPPLAAGLPVPGLPPTPPGAPAGPGLSCVRGFGLPLAVGLYVHVDSLGPAHAASAVAARAAARKSRGFEGVVTRRVSMSRLRDWRHGEAAGDSFRLQT